MKSNYISKVLSHITSKKQKELVEQELNDHIIEKHNFYEEIGYDDNTSFEKADEIMGDSDVVGEQFEALNKAQNIKKMILFIISILLFVSAITYVFKTANNFNNFYDYIACNVIFILNVISIAYGFKRSKCVNSVLGCISCIGILGTGGYYIEDSIAYFIKGEDVFLTFYGLTNIPNETYSKYFFQDDSNGLFEILTVLFVLLTIISIVMAIRVKKLKNKKIDLKINSAISIIMIIFTLGLTALFGYYLYEVPSYRDEVISQTRAELLELDKKFVDNLDVFKNGDYLEIADVMQNEFGAEIDSESVKADFEDETTSKYKSIWSNNSGNYVAYLFSVDEISGAKLNIYPLANDLNGKPLDYCNYEEIEQLNKSTSNDNIKIEDIECPFEIEYTKSPINDIKVYTYFNRDYYYYGNDGFKNRIIFTVAKDNELSYVSSVFN
jgi:FtsH-binding integral membrane protein